MSEKIVINLSKTSIGLGIRKIKAYRDRMQDKMDEFADRLAKEGFEILNYKLMSIPPVYRGDTISNVTIERDGMRNIIRLSINGSDCAFVEFGSGVMFNTGVGGSLHPKGDELGMTIGSYNPDSPNASSPTGWWFTNRYGEREHTYGIPMQAPLYYTFEELKQKIESIAKEVFSNV